MRKDYEAERQVKATTLEAAGGYAFPRRAHPTLNSLQRTKA